MAELDYFMLALLGFFTGLGTTFGAELARALFSKLNGWVSRHGKANKKTVEAQN